MSELLARHRAVIPNWVGIYYDEPIEIVSGKGCRVTDAQGRGYLDFFAGILTNMLGYDVPEVRDAVERQIASGVMHTSTLYLIRGQVELAEKIAKLSGITAPRCSSPTRAPKPMRPHCSPRSPRARPMRFSPCAGAITAGRSAPSA